MNKVINSVLILGSLALLGGACYKVANTNVNTAENNNGAESNTNGSVKTNSEVNSNLEVNTNSVSNTNSEVNTNSSPTADWQTYTNEEYGFSFKYPDEIFNNYTSEDKYPFYRTKISEAPIERTEENPFLDYTQAELSKEKKELEEATVDNINYRLLPSGIKVKIIISRAEGGSIVKRFNWYDAEFQYSIQFTFPSEEISQDFFNDYSTTVEINDFIELVKIGKAKELYQEEFDVFDEVMNTLRKI